MIDGGDFSSSGVAEYFTTFNTISKKNKYRNKMRRFSDEQVKSLENIFETESTLEPRKKLQLARELGLQPRQVAIWFQNKRARWKSKQLERDYSVLLANYNTLSSQFETLKEEKESLLLQLQKLNDLLEKSKEGIECCREPLEREKSSDGIPNHGGYHIKSEFEEKPSLTLPEVSEQRFVALSDDDDDSSIRGRAEYLVLDVVGKPDLVNMVEQPDSSLTSPEDWGSFVSDDLLHLTPSSYKWWDFWS